MANEELSVNVLQFLNNCIDSIEQLWVLLLLHSNPKRVWTTIELTTELRSTDTSIKKRLDDLYLRKILLRMAELHDKHQFTPSTPEIRTVINELARENRIRPYRVIEAIYSRPNKALQAFADAFKLRGDE